MFAGLWDDIKSGAIKTVDLARVEIKQKLVEFSAVKAKAEKNYSQLLAHNEWRKKNKVLFKSEAERQKFQKLLDDGRSAVNKSRTVRNTLLTALKAVNANASDYGLGFVQFVVPVAVVWGVYESVGALKSFISDSDDAVKVETLVAQGVPAVEAVKLRNEALQAQAEADNAKRGTLARVMDNLPLLAGGAVALIVLPKVLELLPKAKRE